MKQGLCAALAAAILALDGMPAHAQLTHEWSARYGGDFAYTTAVVADTSGVTNPPAVYTVGGTRVWPPNGQLVTSVFLTKYSPTGTRLWARDTLVNSGGFEVGFPRLAVDLAGNPVITASLYDTAASHWQIMIARYDGRSGSLFWRRRFSGFGTGDVFPVAIALDANNNIYVTGNTQHAVATVAYDEQGRHLWTAYYGDRANDTDVPAGIAVSPDGQQVYVTAAIDSLYGYDKHTTTIRYDGAGHRLWTRDFPYNQPADVAYSLDGGAYLIVGGSVVKYDMSGKTVWTVGGLGGLSPQPAVTARNGLVLAATAEGGDAIVTSLDSTGHLNWRSRWSGAKRLGTVLPRAGVDAAGNAYLAAISVLTVQSFEATSVAPSVVMFDDTGQFVAEKTDFGNV